MDNKYIKPYAELPYPWTIVREGDTLFYGLNRHTGEETLKDKSYTEILRLIQWKASVRK